MLTINLDATQKIDFKNQRRLFDFMLKFRNKTAAGVVIDIAGWSYEMIIYKDVASAIPLLKMDSSKYLSVVNNQVIIQVPASDLTLPVGNYKHLIKRTKNGVTEAVQAGTFSVID